MSTFLVKWMKFTLVAVVGCGFLAMAIYAFVKRDEIRNAQIEPPLISAQDEALKRRPDQPGGMEIPNRDKLVFDLLDSNSTVSGDSGQMAMMADAADDDTAEPAAGEGDETSATVAEVSVTAPQAVAVAAEVPVKVEEPKKVEVPAAAPQPQPVAAAPVVEKQAVAKPVEKPAAKTASGSWGVQLAAVGSAADGKRFADKAQKQYAALRDLRPNIEATPDGKAYRVQFIGVASREAAAAVCAKLGKQACFPTH